MKLFKKDKKEFNINLLKPIIREEVKKAIEQAVKKNYSSSIELKEDINSGYIDLHGAFERAVRQDMKETINDYFFSQVNTEQFIDEIVQRIRNKQLKD